MNFSAVSVDEAWRLAQSFTKQLKSQKLTAEEMRTVTFKSRLIELILNTNVFSRPFCRKMKVSSEADIHHSATRPLHCRIIVFFRWFSSPRVSRGYEPILIWTTALWVRRGLPASRTSSASADLNPPATVRSARELLCPAAVHLRCSRRPTRATGSDKSSIPLPPNHGDCSSWGSTKRSPHKVTKHSTGRQATVQGLMLLATRRRDSCCHSTKLHLYVQREPAVARRLTFPRHSRGQCNRRQCFADRAQKTLIKHVEKKWRCDKAILGRTYRGNRWV